MNIIKYTCHICNDFFSKTEEQIIAEKKSNRLCHCGGKLHIDILDLNKIVDDLIKQEVSTNINNWAKENGLEWTVELIERTAEGKVKEYYIDELKKRGLK